MKPTAFVKFIVCICAHILIIALYLYPVNALAKLNAEAELNYINFDARDNSGEHVSAHSLTQRYSLLYQTEGKIVDGRMGKYNIALGYEWSTFDTTIKSTTARAENPQASQGHILYQGEILLDPKEIPFRLTAFSRDMNRSSFNEGGNLGSGNLSQNVFGTPQFAIGIINGVHMESGATLVMGVKNGMTNGYNELLRHFPMMMLDYRDIINHDMNSIAKVDNRLSRLAFVSLNKKDNWFHYRLTNYDDYVNPSNNYKETQIQLGTVDQALQRRWIDFANWLQISADGQLTRRTSGLSGASTDNFTEFDLNLFGIARRSSWEARTFNNFNRHKDINGLITYRTTAPLYVSGTMSSDTSWNTRFSYNENRDNQNNQFTDITGGYRVDTFKRAPFTLSQQLDIEKAHSNTNDLFVISATLETTSTARFSRTLSLGSSYNIRNYTYDTTANTRNFLDQSLTASATYSFSNRARVSLRQTNRMTNGTSQYVSSPVQGAVVSTAQYVDPRNSENVNGSTFQSITDLMFDWNPLPRLNIGFAINEDIFLPQNAPRSYKTHITNTADFTGTNFKLSSRNTFTIDNTEPATSDYSLNSNNRIDYTFSRNLDTHASLTYYKAIGNINESDQLNIEQGLNYYYYKTQGMSRRLFEINESIMHTEGSTSTSTIAGVTTHNTSRTSSVSLGAKYYPLRQLVLAGGTRYSIINNISNYTILYYGSLGLNFRLFQASLDYSYGTARSDGRIEKKFTANFKKAF